MEGEVGGTPLLAGKDERATPKRRFNEIDHFDGSIQVDGEALFPAPNQTSPMIDELRQKLQQANWARAGLGLPLLPELNAPPLPQNFSHNASANIQTSSFTGLQNGGAYPTQVHEFAANRSGTATPEVALEMDEMSYAGTKEQVTFTSRKKHPGSDADVQPLLSRTTERDVDSEQNKYKRRPAREWLRGIWKAKYGSTTPDHFVGYKRVLIVLFLVILVLVTVIVVLTRAGIDADDDPLLDPMNNPNIRVAVDGGSI
ncbi:unnamed protein product [Nippostrongylus brasiliensis]|uniref:Zinc finger protein-like 1 homolog n=1 Tax=Nippostrongylus brasiliensis TaxID=27835 RepID=A0A0N4YPV7_NIPBR|nr:unnamed protein product [Nippostrongylus brasiliensis]